MAIAPPSDPPHPLHDPDATLRKMCDNARAIINHLGLDEIVVAVSSAINRPPDELLIVLRSPIGPPRVVELHVDGKTVRARVTPNGRNDPIAEWRTWQCIRDVTLGGWAA